jgi:hypothetical protein
MGMSLLKVCHCQANRKTRAAMRTITMLNDMAMARLRGSFFNSSHLQTGYSTIAINNPKNKGINRLLPVYNRKMMHTDASRYCTILFGWYDGIVDM